MSSPSVDASRASADQGVAVLEDLHGAGRRVDEVHRAAVCGEVDAVGQGQPVEQDSARAVVLEPMEPACRCVLGRADGAREEPTLRVDRAVVETVLGQLPGDGGQRPHRSVRAPHDDRRAGGQDVAVVVECHRPDRLVGAVEHLVLSCGRRPAVQLSSQDVDPDDDVLAVVPQWRLAQLAPCVDDQLCSTCRAAHVGHGGTARIRSVPRPGSPRVRRMRAAARPSGLTTVLDRHGWCTATVDRAYRDA